MLTAAAPPPLFCNNNSVDLEDSIDSDSVASELMSSVDSNDIKTPKEDEEREAANSLLATSQLPLQLMDPLDSDDDTVSSSSVREEQFANFMSKRAKTEAVVKGPWSQEVPGKCV